MADINNKQKKPLGILPWILVVVTLLGLLFIFWPSKEDGLQLRGKNKKDSIALKINDYLKWADKADAKKITKDHHYTGGGLGKLAGALDALSKKASMPADSLNSKMAHLRAVAGMVSADPGSDEHSSMVRSAFTDAADILKGFQQSSYPALAQQANEMMEKVSSIDPEKPLLDQGGEVVQAFGQAALLVKAMR